MRKIFSIVIILVAFIATSANAQIANASGIDDGAYTIAKEKQSYYTDAYVCSVGDDPGEYTIASQQKHGFYLGGVAGVQNFDGHTDPYMGVTAGYDWRFAGLEYSGTWSKGSYTTEADRNNAYVEFDSRLVVKAKVYGNAKQSFQVWLGAGGSYKLNFDYHENENTYVREDDESIVTTTQSKNFEVKGSTMGYFGQAEVIVRPYMSKFNFHIYAGYGQQQRYYDTGNQFHPEFFAGVKVTYNVFAKKTWNEKFLQKTGLSKSQVKKLCKNKAVELY